MAPFLIMEAAMWGSGIQAIAVRVSGCGLWVLCLDLILRTTTIMIPHEDPHDPSYSPHVFPGAALF